MGTFAPHRRRWPYSIAVCILLLTSVLAAPPAAASQRADHHLAAPADDIVGVVDDDANWSYAEEFTYFRPGGEYVGRARVDATIQINRRTVRLLLSITWLHGRPIRPRIGWNCVNYRPFPRPNTSCSNDWKWHQSTDFITSFFGRRASYRLQNDTVYWFDFAFGWDALTGWGEEPTRIITRHMPLTSWHFRCEDRWCSFERNNPTLV